MSQKPALPDPDQSEPNQPGILIGRIGNFPAILIRPQKKCLVWPFNQVDYMGTCPDGHQAVTFSTGYCVFAPSWWEQVGTCQTCKRHVKRKITWDRAKECFITGDSHWME